jgi:hypothetical protein
MNRKQARGDVTSDQSGRAVVRRFVVSHPSISTWLEEDASLPSTTLTGSSPYWTGGGGVHLEYSYATCLIVGLLSGEVSPELGDSLVADGIRLQASDVTRHAGLNALSPPCAGPSGAIKSFRQCPVKESAHGLLHIGRRIDEPLQLNSVPGAEKQAGK